MPAKPQSPSKKSTEEKLAATDAIQLLTNDHKEVKALFEQYDKLVEEEAEDDEKQDLAQNICAMLTAHATAEEEIFYPAARELLGDDEDLIDEATVEHQTVMDLIADIEDGSPGDPLYDARVKVLGEYIEHHVKEEEGEIFPKVKKAGLDADALGAELAARKEELLLELDDSQSSDER